MYALCFGGGLVLFAVTGVFDARDWTPAAILALVLALTLVAVAVFRYRPSRDSG